MFVIKSIVREKSKMMIWDVHVIGLVMLQLLVCVSLTSAGSCRESSLCCNGRDSSCVVQKAPINTIIEDLNDKPCYCDHACLKLGDCCNDFKEHCGVNDCVVSAWGPWSDCDSECGTGIMTRTRTIEREPRNGGKHCSSLTQKRGCQGYKCSRHHDKRVLKETALLLPASLSRSRHANDSTDIRRNLRLKNPNALKYNRDNEYCVEFEVIKATKPCHKIKPYNLLTPGDRVSVRCDLEALVEEMTKDTTTNDTHHNDILSSDSSVDDDVMKPKSKKMNKTKKTSYKCRGEGLPGRNNRFSALAVPSCQGKWLRLTLNEPKKCKEAQFIFV